MSRRSSSCVVCGRSKVPLVYSVQGRLYTWPWGSEHPSVRRTGYAADRFAGLSIERRTTARCLLSAECRAVWEKRRQRQRDRNALPADAVLRRALPPRRGWCRWCGERIYMLDKDGRVVGDRRGRMWHEGRGVHPDAEPEPNCVREYHAQAFTFRDQVFRRDRGVCAECGRDCEAEREAWLAARPEREEFGSWPEWDEAAEAWRKLEPCWEADHVLPLEDGGEHLLANAQTLCAPCHRRKTAAENSNRARGLPAAFRPPEQLTLGDSRTLV